MFTPGPLCGGWVGLTGGIIIANKFSVESPLWGEQYLLKIFSINDAVEFAGNKFKRNNPVN